MECKKSTSRASCNFLFLSIVHFIVFSFCLLLVQTAAAQVSGFGEQQLLGQNTVSNPVKTLPVDMNGDNYPDLIVLSEGKLGWYPNNGDGTFGQRRSIAEDPIQLGEADATAGDIDNDGDIDIVTVPTYSNNIVIYRNNGSNNFTAQTHPYSVGYTKRFVALADLNGDHLPDIIVSNKNYNEQLGWLKNLGNGLFDDPVWLLANNGPRLNGPAVVTDFDHDSDLDLIVNSDEGFQLIRNMGNGQFSSPINLGWITNRYYGGSNELAPIYMAAADLNNDGLNDLINYTNFP